MRAAIGLSLLTALIALAPLATLGGGSAARADDESSSGGPLTPRDLSGDALDGQVGAAFDGPSLSVATVEVPALDGTGTTSLAPSATAVLVDGNLRVVVSTPQPPGPGMGLAWMLAPEGAASAGEAVAIGYTPLDVRAPRLSVRGPRGVDRSAYRVQAAAALSDPTRWSVEVQLPLADLGLPSPGTPIRLALAVRTRTPGYVAWAPADAAFAGPSRWARLEPPEGGWPLGALVAPDAARMAAEDEADVERLAAWSRFVLAHHTSLDDMFLAAGIEDDVAAAPDDVILRVLRQALVEPLEAMSRHQPDLATAHLMRGHVLHLLGFEAEAVAAFDETLARVPGLVEARFGRDVEVGGSAAVTRPAGGATDYAGALAALQAPAEAADGIDRDAILFARGQLRYLQGEFEAAAADLEPLAARYPFSQAVVYAAERSRAAAGYWLRELRIRLDEDGRDDLPHAVLDTTQGEIRLALLEDDAPNTVASFVWLARQGAFDDTPIATVGFFAARFADGVEAGYAIPSEIPPTDAGPGGRGDARRRRPFRGAAVMLSESADGAGAGFALLLGTALHLEREYVAFGRVLSGQDVLERLTAADRLRGVRVEHLRPGAAYRPITVEGQPAPARPR